MITTIMKNISKTDTKLIWKKISHFTPILTYTLNKLKIDCKCFKRFGLLKHCSTHTTHTLPCIPGEFQMFYRVLDPFGYQMDPNINDIAI